MGHKACHFAIRALSRADGRSAVQMAAYCAGRRFWDERAARHHDQRAKRDILSVEMIGWGPDSATADPEAMWNRVEAAETRVNARVAREFEIALPHELPLPVLTSLVRGYCLWLRDTWAMPTMAAVHVPYLDGLDAEIMEDLQTERRPRSRCRREDRGNPMTGTRTSSPRPGRGTPRRAAWAPRSGRGTTGRPVPRWSRPAARSGSGA